MFSVEIDVNNFAPTGPECDREVAAILRDIADRLEGGDRGMAITRLGVSVGSWGYLPNVAKRKV